MDVCNTYLSVREFYADPFPLGVRKKISGTKFCRQETGLCSTARGVSHHIVGFGLLYVDCMNVD